MQCTCNMEPVIKLWPWDKIRTLKLIIFSYILQKFAVGIIVISLVLKQGMRSEIYKDFIQLLAI